MNIYIKGIYDKYNNRICLRERINTKLCSLKKYMSKEDGMGVVEVILIVVVLVGLVFVFKDKMTSIVSNMFSSITDGITKVTS